MIYMRRQNKCKGQRSWITKDKAFSRYNRTIEYIILTKTVTACTRFTQAQDRETPSEEEERKKAQSHTPSQAPI